SATPARRVGIVTEHLGYKTVCRRVAVRRLRELREACGLSHLVGSLIVWPDRLQASIKSRQTRTQSGLRRRMTEFSQPKKTHRLTDGARRSLTGQLPSNHSTRTGLSKSI